ncbi:MAG: mechanosensitive ion channel [Candidatus Competibacter sp.]|nr:mechanosensitive ion channel [Candidatus Competibacter sp.]MDG4585583.1 mechanosensitive ion channel [Candidatus Competibacter sp.]
MNDEASRLGAALSSISEAAIVQILLIAAGAWLLIALAQRLIPALAGRLSGRQRLQALALAPVLRLLVIITTILLVLQRIIEPTFENLVGLLGALGLALGFAAKDYASSLIAGIVALYELPYRPGDWIEVSGTYGEVRAIGMRTVEIVTPDDTVVHIPHLKLWDHAIFNANDGSQHLQCAADFYLHPRHDAAQIHRLLYDVALTSSLLQIDQPIGVIVREKPFGTHYRLKAYPLDPRQQFAFVTDLTVRGKAALLGSGVELASFPTVAGQPF